MLIITPGIFQSLKYIYFYILNEPRGVPLSHCLRFFLATLCILPSTQFLWRDSTVEFYFSFFSIHAVYMPSSVFNESSDKSFIENLLK